MLADLVAADVWIPALDAEGDLRDGAEIIDRIRCGEDTGFGRFPSRPFAIPAAWLQMALTAIDLLPGPVESSRSHV